MEVSWVSTLKYGHTLLLVDKIVAHHRGCCTRSKTPHNWKMVRKEKNGIFYIFYVIFCSFGPYFVNIGHYFVVKS